MNKERQILRATSQLAAAAILTNLLGIVRLKLVALLLGPVGIGLIGVYQNLVTSAGQLASLGLNHAVVREVAHAGGSAEPARAAAARRAFLLASVALALAAGLFLWTAGERLLGPWLAPPASAGALPWLALGVVLAVLSLVPVALLNADHQSRRISLAQVVSALIGTVIGVGALVIWGEAALLVYVLVPPLALWLVAGLLHRRASPPLAPSAAVPLGPELWRLVRLGVPWMLGAAAMGLGILLVRFEVARVLGAEALGLFGAVWTLSGIYLGFLVTAMGTEYFPRLTAALGEGEGAAGEIIAGQMELAFLLALPVLLGVVAIAPWLLTIIYSAEFRPAADVLRLQILGDAFKMLSFPVALALLAVRRGKTYLLLEWLAVALLLALAFAFVDRGLVGIGLAYAITLATYLAVQLLLARRLHGLVLGRGLWTLAAGGIGTVVATVAAGFHDDLLGFLVGTPLAFGAAFLALRRLSRCGALPPVLARLAQRMAR